MLFTNTITLLGFVVLVSGVQVDQSNVITIMEWHALKSIHVLVSFYGQFIYNFSAIIRHVPDQIYFVASQWTSRREPKIYLEKLKAPPSNYKKLEILKINIGSRDSGKRLVILK